jgi:glycosyltransferase involved in cell wall biosynthesis
MHSAAPDGGIEVSVIIPSFRSRATIGTTLESILRQDFPHPLEIIVADSSDDGSADWIREHFPQVTVHHSSGRLLAGAARNMGAQQSSGRLLAFIDADAQAAPDWLSTLHKRLREDPQIVMVSAAIANANRENANARTLYWLEFSEFLPGQRSGFRTVLSSANLLIRREDFFAVKGFDTAFGMSEDLVLSVSIGRGLFLDTGTTIFHTHRTDWAHVQEHLYRLGLWSGRFRRTHSVRGSELATLPLLSFGLTPYRFWHVMRRVWRSERQRLALLAGVPRLLAGLWAWNRGFYSGIREQFAAPLQPARTLQAAQEGRVPLQNITARSSRMRRLSVCYAAPGQGLLATSGSTRNVLSVAEAMSQWADVTVAFRSIIDAIVPSGFRIVAIEEESKSSAEGARDDVAVRGLNPLTHAAYLRTVRRFARRAAGGYDVVFEKGWRFSGYLARAVHRHGTASALIENDVRYWNEPAGDVKSLVRFVAQRGTQWIAARCSRQIPLVIAETVELKDALIALRGVAPERIEVVGLGVDHKHFRPQDQARARAIAGIDPDVLVLLYVGGLDMYHDLGPLIEAMGRPPRPGAELHVVGDGALRRNYEADARRLGLRARFHGQVTHRDVPNFIAAADLCLAPYQPSRFYGGRITFSTLKIPEYMACGRPVASVPHGHILRLIEHEVSGFLLANEIDAWKALLQAMPPREHLAEMGRRAAVHVACLSWNDTAARYLDLGSRLVSHH